MLKKFYGACQIEISEKLTGETLSFPRKWESRENLTKYYIILDSSLHGNDILCSISDITNFDSLNGEQK